MSSSTASVDVSDVVPALAALPAGAAKVLLVELGIDALGLSEEENLELILDIHDDFGTLSVLPRDSIPGRFPFDWVGCVEAFCCTAGFCCGGCLCCGGG